MTEKEHIDFLETEVSREINHIVRTKDGLKGVVNIEVRDDGEYGVTLHRGTEAEATEIENLDKKKLISMLENKL